MTHRFDPTSLREYDIRGIVGETLGPDDARAIGRGRRSRCEDEREERGDEHDHRESCERPLHDSPPSTVTTLRVDDDSPNGSIVRLRTATG